MASDYERFRHLVRQRRTVRAYRPDAIDDAVLEQAIEDACWAPSPHHAQPWRFVIVSSEESRKRLAEAMGERWREDLSGDEAAPAFVEGQIKGSRVRLSKARGLVLVCMSQIDLDRYPDQPRQLAERDMAVQSIGAAIQNLLLALHLNGLGACWMCAPLFCPEVVSETLNLPEDWAPQALITVGWPVEQPPPPARRPLEPSLLVHA
ncbi:MAG: nitroreductase family protein [Chloroflexota bacterium]|nr:nitroreductase family protein [Chloroflexota bacterium]